MVKKLLEHFMRKKTAFYEKELNQQEFGIEKVNKRKGDTSYVKWEGCDNSYNSWINKKDLV